MPDRLPKELRVLYELARVVATGPYSLDEVLARICTEVKTEFGFAAVRLVRGADDPLADRALVMRRAVADDGRVAIPLLVEGRSIGYLLAEGRGRGLGELDLHLLSTVGLVAGVFVAKAEQYEELQRALEELRRADELKDEFVSIASHELRTPIAIVYGIANTMCARGDELPPQQLDQLRQALLEQSVGLRELTDQLLDLSRFDAGHIHVHPRSFKPHDSVEALLPHIAPDRLEDVRVEIDAKVELFSDRYAFERVVGNLIGNALKYGAPPVFVCGRDFDGTFRLAVEDRVRACPATSCHISSSGSRAPTRFGRAAAVQASAWRSRRSSPRRSAPSWTTSRPSRAALASSLPFASRRRQATRR